MPGTPSLPASGENGMRSSSKMGRKPVPFGVISQSTAGKSSLQPPFVPIPSHAPLKSAPAYGRHCTKTGMFAFCCNNEIYGPRPHLIYLR